MSMPATLDEGDELILTHHASLPAFLGLSLRNGLLNLVTFTLYRFWGKTEVRRRLWRSIRLNGEPFEYTGRGVELFLGFLLVLLVVVLPFLLLAFAAQLFGPAVAAAVMFPLYIFLGFLVGYGRFTAFRYLASRSSWRGIRFHMQGSPAAYGGRWLGYGLLSAISFGWFWPAAQRRLAAPLWDGLRFGDRRFRFDLDVARRTKVYGAYAIGWVGAILGYFVFLGVMVAVLGPIAKATGSGPAPVPTLGQILRIYALIALAAPGYIVLFSPFHAAMLRSIVSGISFDGAVGFQLRLRWWEMAWLTVSNVVLVTVSLGFLMPFVEARTSRFLVRRLAASGATDLQSIRQAPDRGPRTGEGLADAFGVSPV